MVKRNAIKLGLFLVGLLALAALLVGIWQTGPANRAVPVPTAAPELPMSEFQPLIAQDIANAAEAFTFTSRIPAGWQVEAIEEIDALSIYDPASNNASSLEQSQIFIRSFTANEFLTLPTVTIWNVVDLTLAGRPARHYLSLKKPNVPPFPGQPSWRNEEHVVTDIRVSNTNPSVFYVIAKRPSLNDAVYQDFLNTLEVVATNSAPGAELGLVPPVAAFSQRITKKPFGIFITPENSPVSPERFSGYHTGVDAEFDDVADDVDVRAIADGTVRQAGLASGFGGVIVVQHEINDQPVLGVYGHLEPTSLLPADTPVQAGQQLGRLGEGNTSATDGERKHLHFALKPGTELDLRGYVATEAELAAWLNPSELFPAD